MIEDAKEYSLQLFHGVEHGFALRANLDVAYEGEWMIGSEGERMLLTVCSVGEGAESEVVSWLHRVLAVSVEEVAVASLARFMIQRPHFFVARLLYSSIVCATLASTRELQIVCYRQSTWPARSIEASSNPDDTPLELHVMVALAADQYDIEPLKVCASSQFRFEMPSLAVDVVLAFGSYAKQVKHRDHMGTFKCEKCTKTFAADLYEDRDEEYRCPYCQQDGDGSYWCNLRTECDTTSAYDAAIDGHWWRKEKS